VGTHALGLARQARQDRHVRADAVGDVARLVWVVEADVDVQPEDYLLARDEAQRVDQVAVALARRDAVLLPQRERMRPGRADLEVGVVRQPPDLAAQPAQLRPGLAGVARRLRGDREQA